MPHAPETIDCDLVVVGAGRVGSGSCPSILPGNTARRSLYWKKRQKQEATPTWRTALCCAGPKATNRLACLICAKKRSKSSASTGNLSLPLLRKAMYGLTDMFDWMSQFGGTEENFQMFDLAARGITQMGPFPAVPCMLDFPVRTQNVKSSDQSMGPGWAGTFVIEKMLEQCSKLKIPVLTSHRAVELLVDDQGVCPRH